MNKICATCKFMVDDACRRFPPPFPTVQPDDWCGEWKHDGLSSMHPITGVCEKSVPHETKKP